MVKYLSYPFELLASGPRGFDLWREKNWRPKISLDSWTAPLSYPFQQVASSCASILRGVGTAPARSVDSVTWFLSQNIYCTVNVYVYATRAIQQSFFFALHICRTVYPVNWLKYCIGRDKVEGTPLLEKFWWISLYCMWLMTLLLSSIWRMKFSHMELSNRVSS